MPSVIISPFYFVNFLDYITRWKLLLRGFQKKWTPFFILSLSNEKLRKKNLNYVKHILPKTYNICGMKSEFSQAGWIDVKLQKILNLRDNFYAMRSWRNFGEIIWLISRKMEIWQVKSSFCNQSKIVHLEFAMSNLLNLIWQKIFGLPDCETFNY